jgi:hypothetical protein
MQKPPCRSEPGFEEGQCASTIGKIDNSDNLAGSKTRKGQTAVLVGRRKYECMVMYSLPLHPSCLDASRLLFLPRHTRGACLVGVGFAPDVAHAIVHVSGDG